MIEYTPIDDLVKEISPDVRHVLRTILERRPPIMLRELVDQFSLTEHRRPFRGATRLANHPDNPGVR